VNSKAADHSELDFNDTAIAFKSKSDLDLRKAQFLFKAFASPVLSKTGPKLVEWALGLRLPVTPLIKATVFEQFCGGESIEDCDSLVEQLDSFHVGSILDFSVEGREREEDFDKTRDEVLKTIANAVGKKNIPYAVFKVTGLARLGLLAKASAKQEKLTRSEVVELDDVKKRIHALCKAASASDIRIMIDAEETWIHGIINDIVLTMMREFNRSKAIVFTTLQMYCVDSLAHLYKLFSLAEKEGFFLGVKLVRGAYLEKERQRAIDLGYPSPIQPTKEACDHDYDAALKFCLDHIDRISLCAGSHNENSCGLLTQLIEKKGLSRTDQRVVFSQLLGMSDHLTYNLAHHGYNVSKYVPYGPVSLVLPYLFRRAEENSSIRGQTGRELQLIEKEIKRRASL
jgi:proline dehydrogenase